MERGDEAIMTRRSEIRGSSTSGREEAMRDQGESAEVSTSEDRDENEGVVPGAEEMDDPSLATPEDLQTQAGDFSCPSSIIKRDDLVGLARAFHLLMGHKVLIPKALDRPAYPPQGYVAISSHHLIVGLRFSLPSFLIRILNLLELAPMQLTPNAYTRLLSFYLIFRRKGIGSPIDNIIRHCFLLKKCPLYKKPSGKAQYDWVILSPYTGK
ncbi:hypothetical protein ACOSP7_006940 [Xanthoceras sorbifolium]